MILTLGTLFYNGCISFSFNFFFYFQRLLETSKRNGIEVHGPVRSINQWIDMSKRKVSLDDGSVSVTCPAAIGYR